MNRRFQADLLVGRRVYDAEGRGLGRVDEILLFRRGDAYEVEGLLIGVNSLLERLGVERLQRRLRPNSRGGEGGIIYWEQIDSIEEGAIRLKVKREEIGPPEQMSTDTRGGDGRAT
jgi:sporulation protein YlmC with PRC-barrel domain